MDAFQKTKWKSLNDKKEYIAIDFCKLFCSLLVVAIHCSPFKTIETGIGFWFVQTVCRMAVPFFFVAAGFFVADKILVKEKFMQYVLRLTILYVLYNVIYIPLFISGYIKEKQTWLQMIGKFFKGFFIVGNKSLWYFRALIIAVLLLYTLLRYFKFKHKAIVTLSLILYLMGTIGWEFKTFLLSTSLIGKYYQIFGSTRNGLFFGFAFVSMGYMIKIYSVKIRKRLYFFCAAFCFTLTNIEVYIIRSFVNDGTDMLFSMPLTILFVFLMVCFIKVPLCYLPVGKLLRQISILIFVLHPWVIPCVNYISNKKHIIPLTNIQRYFMVVCVTVIASIIILYLSKCKAFSWLKFLY